MFVGSCSSFEYTHFFVHTGEILHADKYCFESFVRAAGLALDLTQCGPQFLRLAFIFGEARLTLCHVLFRP
jgi:hypothetical protein